MSNPPTSSPLSARVLVFERYAVRSAAILIGVAVAAVSILGLLAIGIIRYRRSAYSIQIVAGQDLIHVFLIVPICLAGGILRLAASPKSKHLLIAMPSLFSAVSC